MKTDDLVVFRTQHGGLVRKIKNRYVFVEKPDRSQFDVGDTMPVEWGVLPANNGQFFDESFAEKLGKHLRRQKTK